MNNDGYGSDSPSDDKSYNLSSLSSSSSNNLNQHLQQHFSTLPLTRQEHDDIIEKLDEVFTINSSDSSLSPNDDHPPSIESESVTNHRSVLITDLPLHFPSSPTISSSLSSTSNISLPSSTFASSSIFIDQDPHLSVKLTSICSDNISNKPQSHPHIPNKSDIDDLSILTNRLRKSQSLIQDFRLLHKPEPSPHNLIHRIQPSKSKSMKKLRQKHNRVRKQFQAEQHTIPSKNPYREPTTAKINDVLSPITQPSQLPQTQPDNITRQVDHIAEKPSYKNSYFKRLQQRKVDRTILKQWYGDKFTSDRHPQYLRLALNNGQGLTSHSEYSKVHQVAESMINFNVNAAFIPECKLNPFSSKMNDITTIYNSYHPFGTIHTTNTQKTSSSSNIKQHGGVTTCIDSALMTKFNGVEHDEHGRWQTINLLTKNYGLKMYNLYKIHGEHNKCTASAWHNIQTSHNIAGKTGSAEIVLVDDFVENVQKDLDKNMFVVVCADANERVTDNFPRLHRKLTAIGMVNLLEHRMGSLLPPTQKDGHEAIDHIWVSASLLPYIRSIGIAPLHEFMSSDHRCIFLDIDTADLFETNMALPTTYDKRRLKMSYAKNVEKYRKFVQTQVENQHIMDRVKRLIQLIQEGKTAAAITLLESIDQQMYRIQIDAENSLAAGHENPWSPEYKNALDILHKIQNKVHHLKSQYTEYPSDKFKEVYKESLEKLQEAKDNMKEYKENAASLRAKYLDELAEALTEKKTFKTKETAIKVLKHIEKQRDDARKIRNCLKSNIFSSLSFILIPAKDQYPEEMKEFYMDPLIIWNRIEEDNGKNIKNWIAVTDRQQLEDLLLGWQCLHFTQAHDTPLASSEWETIINNTETYEDIQQLYGNELNQLDEETNSFLKQAYTVEEHAAQTIRDINFYDFKCFINDKNESTSTSPSGRHLGHLKAVVDDDACKIIFNVILASIDLQHIPERWKKTVTTLIEKDAGDPKIHRLRTIHIVEPEIQFISSYYWSKIFLQYCNEQVDHITDDQYGARKGRQAQSAIIKQLLTWDIASLQRIPIHSHVADARANFDRNMHHVVSRSLIARQFPQRVVKYYQLFLQSQQFAVRSNYGISNNTYQRELTNRIFGDCQGLGWSAINQVIISSVIDKCYQRHSHPFSLSDHTKTINVTSGVGYFVDDMISNTMTFEDEPTDTLINKAQHDEDLHSNYLNAAGGALAPNKCFTYVLVTDPEKQDTTFLTEDEFPGRLHLRSTAAKSRKEIKRLATSISTKYLGAWINPEHITTKQYNVLLKKTKNWVTKILQGNLQIENIYHSLQSNLMKQLEHPTIASDLSYNECNNIMAKIRPALATKSHYHSKIHNSVTHGPKSLAGFDIDHLYDIQGATKLKFLKMHIANKGRSKDTIADLINISVSNHMMRLGIFDNFFNLDVKKYGYLLGQRTWLLSIWKYLHHRQHKLFLPLPTYKLPRENDEFIMKLVANSKYSKADKKKFNEVRLHKKFLTVSDMVKENGCEIHPDSLALSSTYYRDSSFQWPRQRQLPKKWFKLFIKMSNHIIGDYLKTTTLGQWVSTSHQNYSAHRLDSTHLRIKTQVFEQLITGSYERIRTATTEEMKITHPIDIIYFTNHKVRLIDEPPAPTKEKIIVSSVQDLFKSIASWQRDLWGYFNPKTLDKLIDEMQKPFFMVPDAGLPNKLTCGIFGFSLADYSGNIYHRRAGMVVSQKNQRSSFRSEVTGLLAGMSFINFIERYATLTGRTISNKRKYVCDNESASKIRKNKPFSNRDFLEPNSDVVQQLVHEWRDSPNNPSYLSWVKAHQDEKKKEENWTVPEKLNIYADLLCHQYEKEILACRYIPPVLAPHYPQQQVSIVTNNTRLVREKISKVNKANCYHHLQKYIQERRQIPTDVLPLISWSSITQLQNKSTKAEQIRHTKIIHDKWPTFYQQKLAQKHATGFCPICNKEIEKQCHIFHCTDDEITQLRHKTNRIFAHKISSIHTPASMTSCIIKGMSSPHQQLEFPDSAKLLPHNQQLILRQAIKEQNRIGWFNMEIGFFSSKWKSIAHLHHKAYEIDLDEDIWDKQFLNFILQRAQTLWTDRCEIVNREKLTHIHDIRKKATNTLLYYKQHRYEMGLFQHLINLPKYYFYNAKRTTIDTWNRNLDIALKCTHDRLMKNQQIITKHFKYKKTPKRKKKPKTPKPTKPAFKPREPIDVYLSRLPKITRFFPKVILSSRPPPKPNP